MKLQSTSSIRSTFKEADKNDQLDLYLVEPPPPHEKVWDLHSDCQSSWHSTLIDDILSIYCSISYTHISNKSKIWKIYLEDVSVRPPNKKMYLETVGLRHQHTVKVRGEADSAHCTVGEFLPPFDYNRNTPFLCFSNVYT